MGLLADVKGIDLSFFKDDGFKKWGTVIVGEIGIILFTIKGLIPVTDGITYLILLIAGYTGINIGGRFLAGIEAKKNGTTVKEDSR